MVTGKPNPAIVDLIREDHGIAASELSKFVAVGDNPPTDIALGNSAGIDTCLTLTGVVKNEEDASIWAKQNPELFTPTAILPSFGERL